MSEIIGINRHEWRLVARASADDFEMLVANEEWLVLDRLAAKVRYYINDMRVEPSEEQVDFLDLYDCLTAHMDKYGKLPKSVVELIQQRDLHQ